jgi:hypothetical protein
MFDIVKASLVQIFTLSVAGMSVKRDSTFARFRIVECGFRNYFRRESSRIFDQASGVARAPWLSAGCRFSVLRLVAFLIHRIRFRTERKQKRRQAVCKVAKRRPLANDASLRAGCICTRRTTGQNAGRDRASASWSKFRAGSCRAVVLPGPPGSNRSRNARRRRIRQAVSCGERPGPARAAVEGIEPDR